MNARQYINKYGTEKAEKLAESVGSNLEYFKQLCSGFRKPSIRLAKKLEKKSGGILTKEDLRPDVY